MRSFLSPMSRLAIAASMIMMLAVPAPASAATPAQIQHIIDCVNWLFTDLAKHEQFCTPAAPYFDPFATDNGDSKDCIEPSRFVGYVPAGEYSDCCYEYPESEVDFSGLDTRAPWLLPVQGCYEGSFDSFSDDLPVFLI